jgi:hypothetical protein
MPIKGVTDGNLSIKKGTTVADAIAEIKKQTDTDKYWAISFDQELDKATISALVEFFAANPKYFPTGQLGMCCLEHYSDPKPADQVYNKHDCREWLKKLEKANPKFKYRENNAGAFGMVVSCFLTVPK